jgi:hypothetical protein
VIVARKTAVFAALVLVLSAPAAFAQGKLVTQAVPEFDSLASFDLTVKDLDLMAREGKAPAKGFYVLVGTIGSVIITSGEGEPFEAIIELVTGEWIGAKEVNKYHVFLKVSGPEFEAEFRKGNKKGIKPGTVVIVVVSFDSLAPATTGEGTAAYFIAHKMRTII